MHRIIKIIKENWIAILTLIIVILTIFQLYYVTIK